MKNPFANLFKKKDSAPSVKPEASSTKKENFFSKLIKNRLGKSSVKGEEIVGGGIRSWLAKHDTQSDWDAS